MIRLLPALALALVMGAAAAGPVAALPPGGADPDTPGTSASSSPKSLAAGDRISFTVTGFPAGETVYVKIDDGQTCSAVSVHGACVVHEQKISSSGKVSGSFALPTDLAAGAHWLRFLASEPIVRDGQQVGVKGYTARGSSDFRVVAAGAASSATGGEGDDPSTSGTPTSGATASGVGSGAVVTVAPVTTPTTVPTTASTTSPTEAPQALPVPVAATPAPQPVPWVGIGGLVALLAASFLTTRLIVRRRQ